MTVQPDPPEVTPLPVTQVDPPVLKPGVQTTELIVTAVTTILAFLVSTGKISASSSAQIQDAVQQVAGIAMIVIPAIYTLARTLAKFGHANAVAKVAVANAQLAERQVGARVASSSEQGYGYAQLSASSSPVLQVPPGKPGYVAVYATPDEPAA